MHLFSFEIAYQSKFNRNILPFGVKVEIFVNYRFVVGDDILLLMIIFFFLLKKVFYPVVKLFWVRHGLASDCVWKNN